MIMEILNTFPQLINSISGTLVVAFLAFLVSGLSAYYSSRAIRLSLRAEKRSIESESNALQLRIIEKQTEITRLLNEALMDLSQANTSIKLCKISLPSLLDFYTDNISTPSKAGYQAEFNKTISAIKNIQINNSTIESDIRKVYEDIGQHVDILELEKHLRRADALRKKAKLEFQKSQSIYQDLMHAIEKLTTITLKRKGIEI
jgi:hypothetical protein